MKQLALRLFSGNGKCGRPDSSLEVAAATSRRSERSERRIRFPATRSERSEQECGRSDLSLECTAVRSKRSERSERQIRSPGTLSERSERKVRETGFEPMNLKGPDLKSGAVGRAWLLPQVGASSQRNQGPWRTWVDLGGRS